MAPIARSGRDLHPLPDTPLARAAVAVAARQHRRPHPRPRVRRRARYGDPPYVGVDGACGDRVRPRPLGGDGRRVGRGHALGGDDLSATAADRSTLLRRVDRRAESRAALEKLSRSDAGRPWQAVIRRELARLEATKTPPAADEAANEEAGLDDGPEPRVLRLPSETRDPETATERAA